MPITAPAPALTKERPPGPRNALLGWLAAAGAGGLDQDGMVALFTSELRDIHQRRGGQPDSRGTAGGENEGRRMNIVETSGLGKRYGSTWALRECSLAIPAGHVAAPAAVGAGVGIAAWVITVLVGQTASGQLTASVTNAHAYLPYLAVAAGCAAAVIYATRPERGQR